MTAPHDDGAPDGDGQAPYGGAEVHTHGDHRIATTGALIGLAVPGVVVDDIGTTAKTMPEFPDLWQAMIHASETPTAEGGDPADVQGSVR